MEHELPPETVDNCSEEDSLDRRGFLGLTFKWSTAVLAAILAEAGLETEAEARRSWANRRGGGGWANRRGGGGWANRRGGGGWANARGGGSAGWANRSGGGGAVWVNRRGGGGAAWANRR